ncbi:hypothetical protein WEH80_21615 [Actinomycetes bacterium KLBMP 9759]
MLALQHFHVALVGGAPAGIVALTDGRQRSVVPKGGPQRRNLGLVTGTVGAVVLNREWSYEARRPARRWSSSAPRVPTRARVSPPRCSPTCSRCRVYVLEEITDTNSTALNLYLELGFAEYRRRR